MLLLLGAPRKREGNSNKIGVRKMVSTGAEKSPTASSPLNNADFGARKLQPPCDHRAITGMMFLCTLVLCEETLMRACR